MKTLKIFPFLLLLCSISIFSFAQTIKKESFKVSGECGMCKKKIEKAAKEAGANYAVWNTGTKILTVKYNSTSSNNAKIQQKIAEYGYNTPDFRAPEEAYNNLDKCCQYNRSNVNNDCCAGMDCCKDGKCDMSTCKDKTCCDNGKCDMTSCNGGACCKK